MYQVILITINTTIYLVCMLFLNIEEFHILFISLNFAANVVFGILVLA